MQWRYRQLPRRWIGHVLLLLSLLLDTYINKNCCSILRHQCFEISIVKLLYLFIQGNKKSYSKSLLNVVYPVFSTMFTVMTFNFKRTFIFSVVIPVRNNVIEFSLSIKGYRWILLDCIMKWFVDISGGLSINYYIFMTKYLLLIYFSFLLITNFYFWYK